MSIRFGTVRGVFISAPGVTAMTAGVVMFVSALGITALTAGIMRRYWL
jgi:hypothetical protein